MIQYRTREDGTRIVPRVFAGTVRRELRMERKIRQMRQGSHYRDAGRTHNQRIEMPAPSAPVRILPDVPTAISLREGVR